MDLQTVSQNSVFLERIAVALELAVAVEADWARLEFERRKAIRKRWPNFKSGTLSTEVFERNCNILKGEPSLDLIAEAFHEMLNETGHDGSMFDQGDAIEFWKCDTTTCGALFYFAEIGLIISPRREKGYYELTIEGPEVHSEKE